MSNDLAKTPTPSYQLRASKKYYDNNKTIIKSKQLIKLFKSSSSKILNSIENDNLTLDEIYKKLQTLATYKIYQTDKEARLEIKDRILKTLQNFPLLNENNEPYNLKFLRLGSEPTLIAQLGSLDDISYLGRFCFNPLLQND